MNNEKNGKVAIVILQVMVGIGLAVGITVLEAYVFTQLWLWFVVPLGLSALSLTHSLGVMIVFDFILFSISIVLSRIADSTKTLNDDKDKYSTFINTIEKSITSTTCILMLWLFGYIVSLFM